MTVYLDTETTSLSPPRDEILEIAILDDQGRTLIDSQARSVNHRMWPGAQAIYGVSPADAANAPTLNVGLWIEPYGLAVMRKKNFQCILSLGRIASKMLDPGGILLYTLASYSIDLIHP